MDADRVLLVKGKAGLGNRIHCLLTAILYARLTHRRMVVEWTDHLYSSDGSNVFHKLFASPADPSDRVPVTESIRPAQWIGRLDRSATSVRREFHPERDGSDSWRELSVDIRRIDWPEQILVMWIYLEKIDLLRPHFKSELAGLRHASTRSIMSGLLRTDLLPAALVSERVETFKRENFGRRTVGAHVRYTDLRVPLEDVLRCVDEMVGPDPEAVVFLATDNDQVNHVFRERYPRVISTQKWLPEPGEKLHTSRNKPDAFQGAVEALTDMYLLAECDELVINERSSFSHVAGLLSKAPPDRIHNLQRHPYIAAAANVSRRLGRRILNRFSALPR